jgi:hypothetical protein
VKDKTWSFPEFLEARFSVYAIESHGVNVKAQPLSAAFKTLRNEWLHLKHSFDKRAQSALTPPPVLES